MSLKLFGAKRPIKNIVGIAAGKGGVGKSTLTVNLGRALKILGYKVGILDADLYGPSIPIMLPEDQLPAQQGDRLIPALSNGIAVMSMGFFKSKHSRQPSHVIRAPIANKLIAQFLNQVEWGELDYLLIDFPPGTGDIQITLSQEAELTSALVITTPQEIALSDVRKCIDMFSQVHIPLTGVVENMSYYLHPGAEEKVYLFGRGGGEKLAEEYGVPLLGQIPLDPTICESMDFGKPLPAKEIFLSLAKIVDQRQIKMRKAGEGALRSFELIWKEMQTSIPESFPLTPPGKEIASVRSIQQKSNTTFAIQWTDGRVVHYSLSALQKRCPCAACSQNAGSVTKEVRARKICSVGRYAIQIDFTSGCSKGIYDYNFLYHFVGTS